MTQFKRDGKMICLSAFTSVESFILNNVPWGKPERGVTSALENVRGPFKKYVTVIYFLYLSTTTIMRRMVQCRFQKHIYMKVTVLVTL